MPVSGCGSFLVYFYGDRLMKYAVVLCDGMADYPVEELNGKTPMECAQKPNMDMLAAKGEAGMVRTVAQGLKPGSDVANLSVMGYDPSVYYSGRSPLEASSMGIKLADSDVAIRCNLVTLSAEGEYRDKTLLDYCAGDISTGEAAQLIDSVQKALGNDVFSFYPGISYRHCLVWKNGNVNCGFLTPPHDIPNKPVKEHLCGGQDAAPLIDLMVRSYDVLKDHPVNKKREAEGKAPANSIWLWGQGTRPKLDSFYDKFGLKGSVVSAVDLIRGIAKCADMESIEVEGATGYIDTCFERKTYAALGALARGQDLVYLHFEAPDECGHRHEVDNKIRSIEAIDSRCLSILIQGLKDIGGDYRIMILPDHPTPLSVRTHVSDPVPFLIYDSREMIKSGIKCFTENTVKETGLFIEKGHTLMGERFIL